MISKELENLSDAFLGFAARGEHTPPERMATLAALLLELSQRVAVMEGGPIPFKARPGGGRALSDAEGVLVTLHARREALMLDVADARRELTVLEAQLAELLAIIEIIGRPVRKKPGPKPGSTRLTVLPVPGLGPDDPSPEPDLPPEAA